MSNLLFKNALSGVEQKVPPVWFMRQAGRYHSHYQNLKKSYTFVELCKNPELAAQVALGPVEEFDFDVSILFSDILYPLEALGMGLDYNPGPQLSWHLDSSNFKNLNQKPSAEEFMSFQKQAMLATRELLPKDKSLIGFVGGPWTLFTYAVEGSHKTRLKKVKENLFLFEKFAKLITPFLIENIQLQLEGGAEVVMIFDTAAGDVSPEIFQSLIQPQIEILFEAFPRTLGYYSQKTQFHTIKPLINNSKAAGFGFDHSWHLPEMFEYKNKNQLNFFVQGNFDQTMLYLNFEDFKKVLDTYLMKYKKLSLTDRAGWVCGLGHGVLPETPEKNVKYFVERVREVFSND